MSKTKSNTIPSWVHNLRTLMEQKNYNPRSLSLQAGLNATAVRDMLEGRSQYPRYDTAQALARALDTTPAILMNDAKIAGKTAKGNESDADLELLTEIIARLKEAADEYNQKLTPRKFAAITTTIYGLVQTGEERKKKISSMRPKILDLLDYEMLRQRRGR
jgi:transcriptional regulator with XRE-family HTH domain